MYSTRNRTYYLFIIGEFRVQYFPTGLITPSPHHEIHSPSANSRWQSDYLHCIHIVEWKHSESIQPGSILDQGECNDCRWKNLPHSTRRSMNSTVVSVFFDAHIPQFSQFFSSHMHIVIFWSQPSKSNMSLQSSSQSFTVLTGEHCILACTTFLSCFSFAIVPHTICAITR